MLSSFYYNSYLKKNNFEQISRGIYASQDAWVDPLLIAHMRCPKAVISHDVALHYYGLIDREPSAPTLTIYSGYNTSRLKLAGYKIFFVKKKKNLTKLFEYAKMLRVEKLMRSYMEILL